MGKVANALLLTLAIEIALYLFPETGYAQSSLFSFVLSPENWTTTAIIGWLLPSITVVGAGAILVGSFVNRMDWIWRAAISATFFTFMITLVHLSLFISSMDYFGTARYIIAVILVGGLFIYYLITMVDFVSAKD